MDLSTNGKLLRIFIGESDHYQGVPLHEAIILRAKEEGLAGCTILRGIGGFGANSRIHTTSLLRLSEDLPIIVELVDSAEKIEGFLPKLDGMIDEGLVTVEAANVLIYRANKGDDKK